MLWFSWSIRCGTKEQEEQGKTFIYNPPTEKY
jgi:hypothetical protein